MSTESTELARREDRSPGLQMINVSADKYGHIEAERRSAIQARTAVAIGRPRDMLDVRAKMLAAAQRPGFAEVAEYRLPRGGKTIVGPSIRFAEVAVQALGNIDVESPVIYDGPDEKILEVNVVDLENNIRYSQQIHLSKTMERRQPKDTDTILGKRTNSIGETVYVVAAPESEMLVKQQAAVSRVLRTSVLRLTPGDIIEEAIAEARHTRANRDSKDPAGAFKRIADAFMDDLRVQPSDLSKYLGHPVSQCSPMEMDDLRGLYAAIRDGDTTWSAVMAEKVKQESPDASTELRDKVRAKLGTKRPATPPTVQTPPTTEMAPGSASSGLASLPPVTLKDGETKFVPEFRDGEDD